MKRPPVEFSWDWCEQKKYCGFSSKNWYLSLVSVRAWFSSKKKFGRPPPHSRNFYVGISHTSIPGRKKYPRCFVCPWSLPHELLLNFLRGAALFPSYKKVMLENFLRDRRICRPLFYPRSRLTSNSTLYSRTTFKSKIVCWKNKSFSHVSQEYN